MVVMGGLFRYICLVLFDGHLFPCPGSPFLFPLCFISIFFILFLCRKRTAFACCVYLLTLHPLLFLLSAPSCTLSLSCFSTVQVQSRD